MINEPIKNYRELGFDERLQRLIIERPIETNANNSDAFFEIGERQVRSTKIAEGAVGELAIGDEAITNAKLAALAVSAAKLANLSVTEEKIALLAVSAAKLAESSVTATKIANAAVGTAAIANLAVGSAAIANGAIIEAKIGSLAVTEAKIAALAVTNAKIANLAVDNAKIANATIQSAKIASLDADKINVGTLTGFTIQTALAGLRLKITSSQYVKWYDGSDEIASVGVLPSTDKLTIVADGGIYIAANGAGDFVNIQVGTGGYSVQSDYTIDLNAANDFFITGDEVRVDYNDDNSNDDAKWYSNGSLKMQLTDSGHLYLDDDLTVYGDLDVSGSKNFRIDHPLKPKTHYLRHSCIEAPDRFNLYKGRGQTVSGKAIIELPSYFEELNNKVEYLLTPIGKIANLAVSKEVSKNKVEIISDKDCFFSWIIIGVRNDLYSIKNPMIAEVKKEIKEYLKPKLYGEKESLMQKIDTRKEKIGKVKKLELFQKRLNDVIIN